MALDRAQGLTAQHREGTGAQSKLHIRRGDKVDQFKLILQWIQSVLVLARTPDSASLYTFWIAATCFWFCFSNEAPPLSQRPVRCVHSWYSLLPCSRAHSTVQRQVEQLSDSGLSQIGMGWWQLGGWGRRESPLGSYFFGSARKTNRAAADVWVIAHSSITSLLPDSHRESKSSLSTAAYHLNQFYTTLGTVPEVEKLRYNPGIFACCILGLHLNAL